MISWVLAPLLGWFVPRWGVAAACLVLPVIEYWAFSGLGSNDRNGYENWGLVVLPIMCLISGALAAATVAIRRRRIRRASGPANGPFGPGDAPSTR